MFLLASIDKIKYKVFISKAKISMVVLRYLTLMRNVNELLKHTVAHCLNEKQQIRIFRNYINIFYFKNQFLNE